MRYVEWDERCGGGANGARSMFVRSQNIKGSIQKGGIWNLQGALYNVPKCNHGVRSKSARVSYCAGYHSSMFPFAEATFRPCCEKSTLSHPPPSFKNNSSM